MSNATPEPTRRPKPTRFSARIPEDLREYLEKKAKELDAKNPFSFVEMMDSVLGEYFMQYDKLGPERFGVPTPEETQMSTVTTSEETLKKLDRLQAAFAEMAKQPISRTDVVIDAIERYQETFPLKTAKQ